jgi:GDP-4-dehydro-6-deoxy-D-mannose reductase
MTPSAQQPIIITGGTGFAGSHLVELLLEKHSPELVHVTAFSNRPSFVHALLPSQNIHSLDLTDDQATSQLFADLQPSQIYHLAASAAVGASFTKTLQTLDQNTHIQFSVLEAARQHAPEARMLVVGSAQEYDVLAHLNDQGEAVLAETAQLGPSNPYGVSKVTQDLLALSYFYAYQLPIIRVRPFNHIGERQELGFAIADFAQQLVQIERGQLSELKVGNLTAVRDFTDVKDVVRGYELLMSEGKPGEVYNIGSGQGRSMQSMLDSLLALTQTEVTVVQDQAKMRPLDVKSIIADSSKIKSLGWQPQVAIPDTLQRVLSYWRSLS